MAAHRAPLIVNVTRGTEVQVPVRYSVAGDTYGDIQEHLENAHVPHGTFYVFDTSIEPEYRIVRDVLHDLYKSISVPEIYYGVNNRFLLATEVLMTATEENRLEEINPILALGINVNARNMMNHTPLLLAAKFASVDMVRILLDAGANPNIVPTDKDTKSPLYEAVKAGDLEKVQALIAAGADVHYLTLDGYSALRYAAYRGDVPIVRALVLAGADVSVRDELNDTPLHIAASRGMVETARFLLQSGAELEARNVQEETPLHDAVRWRDLPMVELLISSGADLNTQNDDGETPLHLAVIHIGTSRAYQNVLDQNGRYHQIYQYDDAILRVLLAAGADPAIPNARRQRPEDLARAARYDSIVDVFSGVRTRCKGTGRYIAYGAPSEGYWWCCYDFRAKIKW